MDESEVVDTILEKTEAIESTQFEHLCKLVLEAVETPESSEVTAEGGDGGIDILGHVGTEIYECSFGIEVKQHSDTVSAPVVRRLSGALNRYGCGFGAVMTNSTFTDPAKDEARESDGPPIELINGSKLAELMVEHEIGIAKTDDGYRIASEFWSKFDKFNEELIPSADVPQADNFGVIQYTLRAVESGEQYGPEIVDYLVEKTDEDWTRRQADYYTLAGSALGFLEQTEGEYDGHKMRRWELTQDGHQYLELLREDNEQALNYLCEQIESVEVFSVIIDRIKDEKIDQDELKEIIREYTEVTGTTIGRRATTIRSWLRKIDEVKVYDNGKTTYDYFVKDLSSFGDS